MAGVTISSYKSEVMVPQVKEFSAFGVLSTSEGNMVREIDERIDGSSAVMGTLYQTVLVKRQLSLKMKLLI